MTIREKLSAEAWNVRLVGQTDLDGHGDCMLVNVQDNIAYVGHMGGDRVGTSIVDVSDPTAPRLVSQINTPAGTRSHKVQVVGDLLLVNHEKNPAEPDAPTWSAGLRVYDIGDPARPQELSFFETPGQGVHRMTFWQEPYVWMTGSDVGWTDQFLIVASLADPTKPVEVSRWWFPGMHAAGGETPTWPSDRRFALHHALISGERAYCGWWDAGLVILDISDIKIPQLVSHLDFGSDVSGATHTALPLPGRDLVVVTDEAITNWRNHVQKKIRLVDVSDERRPKVISEFPVPQGDFVDRPGRFGPHNLHEMRPGSFRSDHIVHATYFSAGLRIYDVADPAVPREIGYYVPEPYGDASSVQLNDLTVAEDGLIYVTDRVAGGLYILEPEIDLG
jgi:hypothetical protein